MSCSVRSATAYSSTSLKLICLDLNCGTLKRGVQGWRFDSEIDCNQVPDSFRIDTWDWPSFGSEVDCRNEGIELSGHIQIVLHDPWMEQMTRWRSGTSSEEVCRWDAKRSCNRIPDSLNVIVQPCVFHMSRSRTLVARNARNAAHSHDVDNDRWRQREKDRSTSIAFAGDLVATAYRAQKVASNIP